MTINIEIPIDSSTVKKITHKISDWFVIIAVTFLFTLLFGIIGFQAGILIEMVYSAMNGLPLNHQDLIVNHQIIMWSGIIGCLVGIIASLEITEVIHISCRQTKKGYKS